MNEKANVYLDELIERYPSLFAQKNNIINAIALIYNSMINDGTMLVCGNGGSAADSEHIVGELMKGFSRPRPITEEMAALLKSAYPTDFQHFYDNLQRGIRAISLVSHSALMTAYINDKEPNMVFAQQVLGYGRKNDILFALSTSGNSSNVVNAAKLAKIMGIRVISLTGARTSVLEKNSDICIKVAEIETYKIQELHLPIYHTICLVLEYMLYGEK